MAEDAVMVRTRDSRDDIVAANGSAAWALNPQRARSASYLVCFRADPDTPERDGELFLVGRIRDVTVRPEPTERWVIEISDFADVTGPTQKWKKGQNPIRYGSAADVLGHDPEELSFRPVPAKSLEYSYSRRVGEPARTGITIQEAKQRLAIQLGVRAEDIEIHIRA